MRQLRILLFVVAVATFSSGLSAGVSQGGSTKAKVAIPDDYWYFGYVPEGAIVVHDYWIHNVGGDTLRIIKVTPGCACTGTRVDKEFVVAGDSARLRAVFNTRNVRGKVVKDITIMTDDLSDPALAVKFFAVVAAQHPAVRVEPQLAEFPQTAGENYRAKSSLEILNEGDTAIEVTVVDNPGGDFACRLARDKIGAGGKSQLDIIMEHPPEEPGIINSSVTIEFAGKEKDRITIPISGFYRP